MSSERWVVVVGPDQETRSGADLLARVALRDRWSRVRVVRLKPRAAKTAELYEAVSALDRQTLSDARAPLSESVAEARSSVSQVINGYMASPSMRSVCESRVDRLIDAVRAESTEEVEHLQDCHAKALSERDTLRRRVEELENALRGSCPASERDGYKHRAERLQHANDLLQQRIAALESRQQQPAPDSFAVGSKIWHKTSRLNAVVEQVGPECSVLLRWPDGSAGWHDVKNLEPAPAADEAKCAACSGRGTSSTGDARCGECKGGGK